jgi:hypothetical protein
MTFTGDVLVSYDPITEQVDIAYQNGQPVMTDGFETCVMLAVFGRPNVQNGMIENPSERYDSEFPSVIDRATVSDETRENGIKAIEKALAFLVKERIASSVIVTGHILSAVAIGWNVEIVAPAGTTRYAINWEKGALTTGYKYK